MPALNGIVRVDDHVVSYRSIRHSFIDSHARIKRALRTACVCYIDDQVPDEIVVTDPGVVAAGSAVKSCAAVIVARGHDVVDVVSDSLVVAGSCACRS